MAPYKMRGFLKTIRSSCASSSAVDVVKLLHSKRRTGCQMAPYKMRGFLKTIRSSCASSSAVDVVKLLHSKRRTGCQMAPYKMRGFLRTVRSSCASSSAVDVSSADSGGLPPAFHGHGCGTWAGFNPLTLACSRTHMCKKQRLPNRLFSFSHSAVPKLLKKNLANYLNAFRFTACWCRKLCWRADSPAFGFQVESLWAHPSHCPRPYE